VHKLRLKLTIAVLLILISGSVLLGWSLITDEIRFSLLGLFLLGRTTIQVIRSRIHLARMRKLYVPLLEAIHRIYPEEFPVEKIEYWRNKRLNAELWMKALKKSLPQLNSRTNWKEVINETLDGIPFQQWQKAFPDAELRGLPSEFAQTLAVAGVPTYGIHEKAELESTFRGITQQTVGFAHVSVVLNDPSNKVMRQFIPDWIRENNRSHNWRFIDAVEANKKKAMADAARGPKAELFVNVDSDTYADENALFFSILAFVMFPFLHGMTSNVRIRDLGGKLHKNLLKYLTYFRYDSVNNVERAARWWNETVLSGPWLVVRHATFLSFIDQWLDFKFRGLPVRPGDDRLITFFLNWLKLPTTYVPQVVVYTDCPETLARWKAQQSRWTQSYYIYMVKGFELGQAWELSFWSLLDLVYGGFFSFFLVGAITGVILRTLPLVAAGDPLALVSLGFYIGTIIAVNFARGVYAAITNRDIRGLIAMFYVILYARYLLLIKFLRPLNLTDQGWLGRYATAR
jgi:hypothetical protein